jgi:outer membrane biosynthesis protein TonB
VSRAWADHDNRLPALAAAVALHAGIFALALWAPSRPPPPLFGASVPINLVSSGPPASAAPAQPAPQVQAAQTPAPTPQAPPQPAAPEVPLPAFTQPAQPTHAAPAGPVDLNRLQQMIQSAQHASGEKTSSARRGTVKAQTNPNVGAGAAQGPSASQLAGLEQLLERLWNPNCDVPGGDTVKLKVRFTVGLNGNLIGDPDAGGLEQSGGAVVSAAARRAVDAVRQAEPYAEPYYGQAITVNFDAKEACAKR